MIKAEYVPELRIDKIVVGDRFRKDKGDIEDLAAQIKAKGLLQPIGVNAAMELVWGERRLLAHQHLGAKTIKAFVVAGKNKIDKLEMELMENEARLQMTWVDKARLEKAIFDAQRAKNPKWTQDQQVELRNSSKGAVNQRLQLAEAIELLPELGEYENQDDAWKAYKKLEEEVAISHMRSKTPDAIKHAPQWATDHFMVGDALKGMEASKTRSADFAEIDPPYAIDLVDRKARNLDDGPDDDYNEIDEDEYPDFFKSVASEVYRILRPDSFAVFWYGLQWHHEIYTTLCDVGFKVNPIPAIWYKGQAGQTAQPDIALASCYEPFFLARKGTPRMYRQGRSNVFHFSPLAPSRKIHRTERPVDLIAEILETILFPGSTILVPFLGSGATLRAAYKLGHSGFGWDLSEKNKSRFLRRVSEEFAVGEEESE